MPEEIVSASPEDQEAVINRIVNEFTAQLSCVKDRQSFELCRTLAVAMRHLLDVVGGGFTSAAFSTGAIVSRLIFVEKVAEILDGMDFVVETEIICEDLLAKYEARAIVLLNSFKELMYVRDYDWSQADIVAYDYQNDIIQRSSIFYASGAI